MWQPRRANMKAQRSKEMPKIQEDEHGPWIDLDHTAIRPIGPTRFKLGEQVDEFHFGGSTLHGVGKVDRVRGGYQEAWIVGPKSKKMHEKQQSKEFRSERMTFEFCWTHYVLDLATFKRGNPAFDAGQPVQKMMRLKSGRARFMANIGYTMGQIKIEDELVAQGKDMSSAVKAHWEAAKLADETPMGSGPKPARLRM
jgi:hypothetical protein